MRDSSIPAAERVAILVVEDDDEIREALAEALSDAGYEPSARANAVDGLRSLETEPVQAVLTDIKMPGMDGIEFCRRVSGDRPDIPVLVMTAFGDVRSAVSAMRAGAFDFITKPLDLEQLKDALARALRRPKDVPALVRLSVPTEDGQAVTGLIGSGELMTEVRQAVQRAAVTSTPVLVTGESGTGKELVARALHEASDQKGPFVAVSCAAMPANLLESELFGHERGAFTGAQAARPGLMVQARGGTLFLDEIGDMPLELQPKLLRALQERVVRPVGATREVPFDARVVAATNKPLERAVSTGAFREDLYFRINVFRIHLPPLRERGRDVIELAEHFLARSADSTEYCLTERAEELLMAHHWPGNVRELQNCMTSAAVLASGGRIGFEELPTGIRSQEVRDARTAIGPTSLQEVERRHIAVVLRAVGWNKAEAARKLGIDRATLYRKLRQFGLTDPE